MSAKKVIAFANSDRFCSSIRIRKLEELGFEVKFCRNAAEVLQLFDKPAGEIPDMLMTDSFLAHGPELPLGATNGGIDTGLALCGKLRVAHRELPIIVYACVGRTLEVLGGVKDRYLVVIDDGASYGNPTKEIIEAAQKMLA
jgi:hypothetical protein